MRKLPNWLGELKNLRALYLSSNKFEGPIPTSLWTLQHLEYLYLSRNELNGSLPVSIGQLSQLQGLFVGSNHMSGSLSEQHFLKLSNVEYLRMGSNSFHLNVSPNWVPPFQVKYLFLDSCHLGPSFPAWLQSQKNLEYLDLSNDNISSPIPDWFWNISLNLQRLNLSHNQLQGQLPNSLNFYGESNIDFSSNLFEGPIPFSIKGVYLLDLSHNKFSGPIPLSKGESMLDLRYLLLSDNQITGAIPSNIEEICNDVDDHDNELDMQMKPVKPVKPNGVVFVGLLTTCTHAWLVEKEAQSPDGFVEIKTGWSVRKSSLVAILDLGSILEQKKYEDLLTAGIVTTFHPKGSISTFEYIESGIAKFLVNYLSNGLYMR
ncbi:unnamed protein product, partial [Vitis vinifera]